MFGGVFIAVFIHALLAFPRGYLETRIVFSIVAVAYVALTAGSLLASLFDDFSDDCAGCPPNAFLIVDSPTAVERRSTRVLVVAGIPALLASLYVFRRRWKAASAPMRRVFLPVYLAAGTTIVLLAIALVDRVLLGAGRDASFPGF